MTKNQPNERNQIEMLTIDHLVPEDHLVRKLEPAIDFSFIYPLVEHGKKTFPPEKFKKEEWKEIKESTNCLVYRSDGNGTSRLERKVLDSWGISVPGETPQALSCAEEARRTPPGKQAPGAQITPYKRIF